MEKQRWKSTQQLYKQLNLRALLQKLLWEIRKAAPLSDCLETRGSLETRTKVQHKFLSWIFWQMTAAALMCVSKARNRFLLNQTCSLIRSLKKGFLKEKILLKTTPKDLSPTSTNSTSANPKLWINKKIANNLFSYKCKKSIPLPLLFFPLLFMQSSNTSVHFQQAIPLDFACI